MPIKNKQTEKEAKVKDDKTAQQEQCSVVAIYYYMTKNMKLQDNKDALIAEFKNIYPNIAKDKDGIKWENTFMEQGKVFADSEYYTKSAKYNFGWWDAPTKNATSAPFSNAVGNNTTTVLTQIWEMFDDETKKLFANKKDTWNTADMYLVRNGRDTEIIKWVEELKKEFLEECCVDRGVFIGTINTYLTKLVHMKVLIPISLKKKTDDTNITIKETNMHEWGESGKIEIVKAKFKHNKHPWAYFNVKADGTEITFGAETGIGGNSLQYFADFKVGDYDTGYLIENRLSSGANTKAEVKDIVLNNKGNKVRAAAQTGQVPQPEFEELIKEYTGEAWDFNVPRINEQMSASQIQYWNAYLKDVQDNKNIIGLNLNGFKVLKTPYPLTSTNGKLSWIEKVSEIDSDYLRNADDSKKKYGLSPGNFHAEFRLKLKQLRFIRALQKANGKLPELLVHLYYLAAKQNIKEGDIHGPFLKIS